MARVECLEYDIALGRSIHLEDFKADGNVS